MNPRIIGLVTGRRHFGSFVWSCKDLSRFRQREQLSSGAGLGAIVALASREEKACRNNGYFGHSHLQGSAFWAHVGPTQPETALQLSRRPSMTAMTS